MIGKLKGIVDSIAEDHLILDVNGVGYFVFGSHRLLGASAPGEAMELIIETHVREDHIHLFGFANVLERDGFKLLTTVQGVGARMGLAILGQFTIEQLQTIIAAQDKTQLTMVSGVGPKLAERIITELKNKVANLGAGATMTAASAKGNKATIKNKAATKSEMRESEDAVSALVNLGYGRAEAFSAVARAQSAGESGIDALIKAGLQELSG